MDKTKLEHIKFKRIMIFLDEWLFYFLLITLYIYEKYFLSFSVAIIGVYAIVKSYKNYYMLLEHYGVPYSDNLLCFVQGCDNC